MPVETWYLSQKATDQAKRLGRLKGWRKEVAQVLLSRNSDDKSKVDIRKLVATEKSRETQQTEMIDQTVSLLPKNSRSKAKILAQHLLHNLHVDENGRIVYPDGSFGSAFIDALKYFTAPKSGIAKVRAPFDVVKLTSFLQDTNVPMSAISQNLDLKSSHDEKKWVAL